MVGTPVRDVHTQTHMYSTHPRLQDRTHGRYAGQGRAHTDTHVQYTSPPTRPHIRQVRQSGTCTHRHMYSTHPRLQDHTYGRYTGQGRAHIDRHPRLQDHTYGRYTGQGRAHTDTHVQYTSPPTRPHIRQVRRSGTCTHRHMYSTHPRLQDCTHGRYAGQGHAHTDTHLQYTSLPTRPHIRQVRRSGTCTHRHTCTVHIPAYKTAHMAGTPVRDVHTQTDKYYTHVHISTFAFRIML